MRRSRRPALPDGLHRPANPTRPTWSRGPVPRECHRRPDQVLTRREHPEVPGVGEVAFDHAVLLQEPVPHAFEAQVVRDHLRRRIARALAAVFQFDADDAPDAVVEHAGESVASRHLARRPGHADLDDVCAARVDVCRDLDRVSIGRPPASPRGAGAPDAIPIRRDGFAQVGCRCIVRGRDQLCTVRVVGTERAGHRQQRQRAGTHHQTAKPADKTATRCAVGEPYQDLAPSHS